MNEVYGWVGKILRVDLTKGEVTEEATLPKHQDVVGGVGIGYKVMWDEVPPEVGPFDPENRLVFAVGPLTGTEAPGATRTIVVSKSPQVFEERFPERSLTTKSAFGGTFGPQLKFAGYDAIVFYGKSDKPVYLWVQDGKAELKDASKLWGLDAYETTDKIREELGDINISVATTGQAGENLSRIACIISRGHGDHGAGQGGFGAVMGSKKLKAIAVRGTKGIATMKIAQPAEFRDVVSETLHLTTPMAQNPRSLAWVPGADPYQGANFWQWQRADLAGLCDAELAKKYRVGRTGCCPLNCYDEMKVPGVGEGSMMCIQYTYAWVGKTGVEDFMFKDLSDRYSIDMYELYLMVPWVVSLFQKGIITEEETGIPFSKFPGKEFLTALLKKIAFREGFGDTLAEGTARAAKKLGVLDSLLKEELAQFMNVPAEFIIAWSSYGGHGFCGHYDPRNWIVDGLFWAMEARDPHDYKHNYIALSFWSNLPVEMQKLITEKIYGSKDAISPIGDSKYNEAEAMAASIDVKRSCVKDALTLCDWCWPLTVSPYPDRNPPFIGDTSLESKLFSSVTGIKMSEENMNKVGERVDNLMRAVLVSEMNTKDMARDHDALPDHYFENRCPTTQSPPVDRRKFEALKGMYYKLQGWDEHGLPTRAKLEELGLKDVADELGKRGLLGKKA